MLPQELSVSVILDVRLDELGFGVFLVVFFLFKLIFTGV